ncbi:MAG: hypothetical protein LBE60_15550 [Microbacterium sp.]|jgi:hypothetical protein|uniref:hypothetical protein n=1 Tax=Microbacterium sp. TaxID=51671 RepID=UPI00282470F9|nr:hypothetical protein [Microbacterium sp.]MDR2323049.1 hypothetical protein [Microbacterium sp.]
MGIDLHIPGDPEAIHGLADFLDRVLGADSDALDQELRKVSRDSDECWTGRTGVAFRQTIDATAKAIDPVDEYARDAAAVFRAYAQRIIRGRHAFADHADDATVAGLVVAASVIQAPVAPKQYIGEPGTPAPIEFAADGTCIAPPVVGAYEKALKAYNRIADDVGVWWGDLENWIDEHMTPLIARLGEFDLLTSTARTLGIGNDFVRGTLFTFSGKTWEASLKNYETHAEAAQVDYDSYFHRLRSGDPKLRNAAARVTRPELLAAREALNAEVSKIRVGTRIIPLAGTAIDVVSASLEVMSGGSASSAAVGLAGSVGGGIIVDAGLGWAAAASTLEVPPLAAAIVIGVLAVAAGRAAQSGWEGSVSLDVREAIDAGDFGYAFG